MVASLLSLLTLNTFFIQGPWSWGVGFVYIGYDTLLILFVTFEMLKVLRQSQCKISPVAESSDLSIGIIITARNEASVLARCLKAIDDQTDLPEVVHWIDDGSTDETAHCLKHFKFQNLKKFEVHFKAHSGKADSLNQVWPMVQASILVTLDADTILEKDAVSAIRNAFRLNSNLAVTQGILTPRRLSRSGSLFENFQRFEYLRSFLARRAWMNKDSLILVSGAFAAYRKHVLAEVGGYDPKSRVEDYDLTHRIYRYRYDHQKNYQVEVTVSARAYTDVPSSLAVSLVVGLTTSRRSCA